MSAEDQSGKKELPSDEPKMDEEAEELEEQPQSRRRTSSFKRNDPDMIKARTQARQSASRSHSGSTSPTVASQPLPGTSLSPGQKLTTLPGTSANYATSSLENMKVSPTKSSPAKSSPSRSPGSSGRRASRASMRDEPLEVVEEEEEPKSPPKTSFDDFRPFNAASVSRELGSSQRSSDDSKASSGDTIEEERSTRMVDEAVAQKLANLAASQRQIPRIVLPDEEEEAGPSEPTVSSPPTKASKRKSMTSQQNVPKKPKGRGEPQVDEEESPRSGVTTRSATRGGSKHDESEHEGH